MGGSNAGGGSNSGDNQDYLFAKRAWDAPPFTDYIRPMRVMAIAGRSMLEFAMEGL